MKAAWLMFVAVGAGTMLAGVFALITGLFWWGQCLLYAEGQAPKWCEAVPIYLLLLWAASIAFCVWLTRKGVRL